MALDLAEGRLREGKTVAALCDELALGEATLRRWWHEGVVDPKRPGPKGPEPSVVEAMRQEVEDLVHVKQRTWGTQTIYEKYERQIPRPLIAQTIRRVRRRKENERRAAMERVEFLHPDDAWSTDLIEVRPAGKNFRLLDECSRANFCTELRLEWTAGAVVALVEGAFGRYGAPLVLKHDNDPLYISMEFQAMLAKWKVVPLPSPPYYPQANGRLERSNGGIRQWLLPLRHVLEVTKPEEAQELVAVEVGQALLDDTNDRPKEVLGWRTPKEAYLTTPKAEVDRGDFYARWTTLKDQILKQRYGECGILSLEVQRPAWRIAAKAVLGEFGLVRVLPCSEVPEV